MTIPRLIVVTGRPAAGKTTLAHILARTIRCPALCRDEFKEGLVNTGHVPALCDEYAQRQVYDTFFQAIELLLRNGITLVAEAAFQHSRWVPKLEPLHEIAQIRIVVCSLDPAVAQARFIERGQMDPERARYHGDRALHVVQTGMAGPISTYTPPRLAVPTLAVDTSDGYHPKLEKIVEFAMQSEGEALDVS